MRKSSIIFAPVLLFITSLSFTAEAASSLTLANQASLVQADCEGPDGARTSAEDDEDDTRENRQGETSGQKRAKYIVTESGSTLPTALATTDSGPAALPKANMRSLSAENSASARKGETKPTTEKTAVLPVVCKNYFPASGMTVSVSCE